MRVFIFSIVFILITTTTLVLIMVDRGIFPGKAKTMFEGFQHASIFADSLATGAMLSTIILQPIENFFFPEAMPKISSLNAVGWPFACYSLFVGSVLIIFDFASITLFQGLGYVALFIFGLYSVYQSKDEFERVTS